MNRNPRVSIVLPTYNGQKYLLGSIASCLLQTYDDLELIIVDDASTDGTRDIIASVDDPRVVRFRHETNRRLSGALNTGFAASRGEYLTWTSDDNQYTLGAIRVMVDYLDEHPDVDFVYSGYWLIDGTDAIRGETQPGAPGDITVYDTVGACFMYRRTVYEQIGDYNENLFLVEDYEYWLRVAKSFRMESISRPLYYYRVHNDSLSTRHNRYDIAIAAAKLLESDARRRRLSWAYERSAQYAYCQKQKVKAARHLLLAIYYQPNRLVNGEIVATLLRKIPKFIRHL